MSRHLTLTQKRILERILQSEHGATRDQIVFAIYGAYGVEAPPCGPNSISVHLSKVRPILTAHGIRVENTLYRHVEAYRYYIPAADRARARVFLAAEAVRLAEPIKGYRPATELCHVQ